MKTNHTLGPWYHKGAGSYQHIVISESTGDTIAVVYHDNRANARLIATAPELLEALQKLIQCPDLNLDSLEDETIQALKDARAVIEKATM